MEIIKTPDQFPKIKWHKPTLDDLRYEGGEIERTLEQVFKITKDNPEYQEIKNKFALSLINGNYIQLTEEIWSKLENTDSYNISKGDFKLAKEAATMNNRVFNNLINAIREGKELPCPTIVDYGTGFHKIAGNTRLMIARAKGEYPMVLIAQFHV